MIGISDNLTANLSWINSWNVLDIFYGIVMCPSFDIRVILLSINTIKCGVHIINCTTNNQLLNLVNVIFYFNFSLRIVTLFAINCVSENISIEPLCIVKCYIKINFSIVLFMNMNMT